VWWQFNTAHLKILLWRFQLQVRRATRGDPATLIVSPAFKFSGTSWRQ